MIAQRILVVDDHPDITEILCMHLELMGHVARHAEDGTTALELAQAFDPVMAIVDIGLPDISGYEVCRALRARGSTAFIVALTGWGEPGDIARAYDAGFDRHVLKPIDSHVLRRLVNEGLRPRCGDAESTDIAVARIRSAPEHRSVWETPYSHPGRAVASRR
jgi:DNA-binding response OmpR family regulator